MIIAINTIQPQTTSINFDVDFLVELMLYKTKQEPENNFVFIVNTAVDVELLPANCKIELIKKEPTSASGLLLFSSVTLPAILKKIQAQMVMHLAGYGCITGSVSQVVFTNTALSATSFVVKKSLQKASCIVVGSELIKNELVLKLQIPSSKFQVIQGVAHPLFTPLNYIESNIVKDGNADSREYFLAVSTQYTYHEFINLLKAFTAFKKWQKSSMKLLVIGSIIDHKKQLNDKITTYKYREDVELQENISLELEAKLFGAAYAVLLLSTQSQYQIPILQAFQANVPIIAIENKGIEVTFNEAILVVSKDDVEMMADNMKLLYRDENLRSKKIAESQTIAALHTYENSYVQLQNALHVANL